MARISLPTFRLYTAPVDPSRYNQPVLVPDRRGEVIGDTPPQRSIPEDINKLRWTHEPNLGLPRQPFKVWRHHEKFQFHNLFEKPFQVSGGYRLESFDGDIYYAYLEVDIPVGSGLIIIPIDRDNNPVTSALQRVGPGFHALRFLHPFTKAYRFLGRGQVRRASVYLQSALINSDKWELIQEIGFPFDPGSIRSSAYDTRPQGVVGNQVSPRARAQAGLTAEALVQEPLPGYTTPGGTVPEWTSPPRKVF